MMQQEHSDDSRIVAAQLSGRICGMTLGLLCGFGLFLATMWLVAKGGENVGQHLGLLCQYFPGYDVSFIGAWFGFLWGCLVGYILGRALCFFYNFIARWA